MTSAAFDKLADPVRRWVRRNGWSELRDIQVRAINSIHDGSSDLIIAASTAGGKTEAAFLPLVSRVLDARGGGCGSGGNGNGSGWSEYGPGGNGHGSDWSGHFSDESGFGPGGNERGSAGRGYGPGGTEHDIDGCGFGSFGRESGFDLLYIGPLKALITDQADRLDDICEGTGLPVVPWHGDISQSVKSRALKNPRGILLITPESLEALFIRRGMEIPRLFAATRAVVIDEIHSLIDSERGMQMLSLLTRLELALERPIRRIGLSATLGDMRLARAYLRPDDPERVEIVEDDGGRGEIRLQLRGYTKDSSDDKAPSATRAIAEHMLRNLRGSDNLIFAGTRQSVEIYADMLREMCERERMPQEFHPHHANLSREHREFVEHRLKDKGAPTTAICTSTLELGIDIGDVTSIAQIGAPFTVAALRQRLGRSGRREGQPAILRQYVIEARLDSKSSFVDRLRLGLVRSVAMIDLLLEGWCEPPKRRALHLSTLTHQILSIIAERGGATAGQLHRALCREGPFRAVTASMLSDVLRSLGSPKNRLIEQTDSGLLLLGSKGEKMVEHYGFYAVFKTPEEYRLIADGRELGTIPIDNILTPGMLLIFSGRRWVIREVHQAEKTILVSPEKAGKPPLFGGDPGDVHDKVVEKMFDIFEGDAEPVYMDKAALEMLRVARSSYERMGFRENRLHVSAGGASAIISTRVGTVKTTTLALALGSFGFEVMRRDGFLQVQRGKSDVSVADAIARLAGGEKVDLFLGGANLHFEKFHPYLSPNLLINDALSSRIAATKLTKLCGSIDSDFKAAHNG